MTTQIIEDVNQATDTLLAGNLCAIPTETVYGLAADATNLSAIERVFLAKGRPRNHPLIVHVSDFESALHWISALPEWAIVLAHACWPGPLTLVGIRQSHVSDAITGGQDTVAVRVPSHDLTLAVLKKLKDQGVHGVVAPSANLFGHVSPTTAQHVYQDLAERLNDGDAILDGGPCSVGIESTIVLATQDQPVILRPGAVTQSDIERITGVTVGDTDEKPSVSGSLASHYAPQARVILTSEQALPEGTSNAGLLALREVSTPPNFYRLDAPANIQEFAACLYSALRKGDELGLVEIYVVAPPDTALTVAINDRLTRAAYREKEQHQ